MRWLVRAGACVIAMTPTVTVPVKRPPAECIAPRTAAPREPVRRGALERTDDALELPEDTDGDAVREQREAGKAREED